MYRVPRQRPKEGKRAEKANVRDARQGAVPTMTGRAIIIPDIRKPPSGRCPYDPKHDMRAKSDAYQGITYGISKDINGIKFAKIMHQIKSAIFADRQ